MRALVLVALSSVMECGPPRLATAPARPSPAASPDPDRSAPSDLERPGDAAALVAAPDPDPPAPRPKTAPSRPRPALDVTAQALLDLHNRVRAAHCAAPLEWSPELAKVAQAWARHLVAAGCAFEHSRT